MAEPRAEKRGTLRGPPFFRSAGDGRKGHKSPTHGVAHVRRLTQEGSTRLLGKRHNDRRRVGGIDRGPLMAARTKEIGMHDNYDPQRIENFASIQNTR